MHMHISIYMHMDKCMLCATVRYNCHAARDANQCGSAGVRMCALARVCTCMRRSRYVL